MADLDLPELSNVRAALTKMGKTRGNMQGPAASGLRMYIIRELYTEIRSARIAGHSWENIQVLFAETFSVPMSKHCLRNYFRKVDLEYEAETGIAALPVKIWGPKKKKGKARKENPEG